jgi:Fur family peroxide stress response transcriptional regulator
MVTGQANDVATRVAEIVTRLREAGHRITPQRMALLEILCASERHPNAGQLHEALKQRFPTTSLATVYKTLSVLKALGEVQELGFSDDDNRYDAASSDPHPHLICIQCREIIDADVAPLNEMAAQVAAASGYRVLSHRVEFYGLCPTCQAQQDHRRSR